MSDEGSKSTEKTVEKTESKQESPDIDEELERLRNSNQKTSDESYSEEVGGVESADELEKILSRLDDIEESTESSFEQQSEVIDELGSRLKKLEQNNRTKQTSSGKSANRTEHLEDTVDDLRRELRSIETVEEQSKVDEDIATRLIQGFVLLLSALYLIFNTPLTFSVIATAAPIIALSLLTVQVVVSVVRILRDRFLDRR